LVFSCVLECLNNIFLQYHYLWYSLVVVKYYIFNQVLIFLSTNVFSCTKKPNLSELTTGLYLLGFNHYFPCIKLTSAQDALQFLGPFLRKTVIRTLGNTIIVTRIYLFVHIFMCFKISILKPYFPDSELKFYKNINL
jgi:hypothetical protein